MEITSIVDQKERRRTGFEYLEEKAAYDAKGLTAKFDENVNRNLERRRRTANNIVKYAARNTDDRLYKMYLYRAVSALLQQEELSSIIADTATDIAMNTTESVGEVNDHGVPIEEIMSFYNKLNLRLNVVSYITVLDRLKNVLTPKKMKHLVYWQDKNHDLDVVKESDGILTFCTLSVESPTGRHRDKTYIQAKRTASANGARLMDPEIYTRISFWHGISCDNTTSSWLAKSAYYHCVGRKGTVDTGQFDDQHDENRGLRITIEV